MSRVVKCPQCQARLRSRQAASERARQVVCPVCRKRFRLEPHSTALRALLAHEDEQVCRQLRERLEKLGACCIECRSPAAVEQALLPAANCLLLLDVAFAGSFPFALIEQIRQAGNPRHRVLLLASVYNRTAYKKQPVSLYGADAYLELHHIGDRLLSTVSELFPQFAQRQHPEPVASPGTERLLQGAALNEKAGDLARLLVADILLYHQDLLEQGLAAGTLQSLFDAQLAEGRRLLQQRLPATAGLPVDFIQQAFDAACRSYSQ